MTKIFQMASARTTYPVNQRIAIIQAFYENGRSPTATLRRFKARFGQDTTLSLSSIQKCVNKFLFTENFNQILNLFLIDFKNIFCRLVAKFEETGSVLDNLAGNVGPPTTVTTPENIQRVGDFFEAQPSTSQRKASQQLEIKRTSLQKIMKDELSLFPYKIQIQQPLSPGNFVERVDFANVVLQMIDENKIDINKIHFTDEAHFDLNGYVNKQNYRHWGTSNPHLAVVRPLHPQRVTVWCAISSAGIIGPIIVTETINGDVYRDQILEVFFRKARRHGLIRDFWFMQDGARPHRTPGNLARIAQVFGDRIIGLDAERHTGGGIDWPPYSADLNVDDFFLWGYVKDRVYQTSIENTEQLIERIKEVIKAIPDDMRRKACAQFETRLRHIIVNDGKHFENIIH